MPSLCDTPSIVTSCTRRQLRQVLRQRRRALTPHQQQQASRALCQHLRQLPEVQRARRVALYLPNDVDELGLSLQTPLDGRYLKADWLHDAPSREAVPRTYRLPLDAFAEVEPELDLAELTAVTIQLAADASGTLLLDDVGVRSGPRHPQAPR